MMPLISVIIVNYNGRELLAECLDSLRAQSFRDFEVILVDNASTDGSVNFVRNHYPEVKIVESSENLGFGGGNNLGIRFAKGQFIALLNNDAVADRDWLLSLWKAIQRSTPEVGMYACKVLNYYDRSLIDSVGLLLYPDGIARGRGRLEKDYGQYDREEEVFFPSGSAALYSRNMLEEIGVFDEDFFLYLEEVDLGLRARWAGWRCVYVPKSVVCHKYSTTTKPYSPIKAFYVERNRVWVVLKNFTWSMVMLSIGYSILRYLFQGYGILTRKGAAGKFVSQEPLWRGVWLLVRAYVEAICRIPEILKKRGQIRGIKKISPRKFRLSMEKYRLFVKDLALRD